MEKQVPFWLKNAPVQTAQPKPVSAHVAPVGPAVTQAEAEAVVAPDEVLPPEAVVALAQPGIESGTAVQLRTAFAAAYARAGEVVAASRSVRVTDVSQTADMDRARRMRLELKAFRCAVESVRKALKADSLARGRAVDGVANAIKAQIEPAEEYLLEQEEFAKREAARRENELREARRAEIAPYLLPTDRIDVDLANLSPQIWESMLEGAKLTAQHREETMRQEAEARAERERADREERARVAAENERLRREKAEADAALIRERAEAKARQDKADAETRALREHVEAEARAKAKAEADASAEAACRAEEERRAAAAPDREKVFAYIVALRAVPVPDVRTDDAAVGTAILMIKLALKGAQERLAE